VTSSLFGALGRLFARRRHGHPPEVPAPRPTRLDSDAEHGPVEDWFVRTARLLLGPLKSARAKERQLSPLQQQLASLAAENALLRADAARLAEEVVALRTLVYVRRARKSR
jgi:hypothetical protein